MMPDFSMQSHGGAAAWGLAADSQLLDLSVNVNPYGPPSDLIAKIQNVAWWHYPDPEAQLLKQELAATLGVSAAQLALGNGANELIWSVARTFLGADSSRVFSCFEPCYSEFRRAATQIGGRAAPWLSSPDTYLKGVQIEELAHFFRSEATAVVYICNPNSPIGAYLTPSFIKDLAKALPELMIVLDESFLSLSYHHVARAEVYPPNVIRIVSMTKDFALAGLRLGYALAAEEHIKKINANIPTWSLNSLAQEAGLWCLAHPEFLHETRARLLTDREELEAALHSRGIETLTSSTVFLMLRLPSGQEDLASKLLARHKILLRTCGSYGWPQNLRIAARPRADRERFLQALDTELL